LKSYLLSGLLASLLSAAPCVLFSYSLAAQEPPQLDIESQDLTAGRRVFNDVGPGLRAMREGSDGRLYLLVSPQPGVLIYEANFKPVMQIGAALSASTNVKARPAAIVFGEDCDVDAQGNIYVADRGANSVLIFSKEGSLLRSIPVTAPVALAALTEGEVAVATLHGTHLITVYDKNGRDVREFGDPEPLSDRDELNRYLSTGLLATNAQGQLFYAFPFVPEPTVRVYEPFGVAEQEIQYTAIDALQVAQAARKEIDRQEKRHEPPYLKRNLTAVTVDRGTGELWIALHNKLLHFNKDGNRLATYLLYTPDGGRIEATSILVNSRHILAGTEAVGVYEFARPDATKEFKTDRATVGSTSEKKSSP
jgi:hypothetical protein